MKVLIFLLAAIPLHAAEQLHISGWKDTATVKESQVLALAKAALDKEIGSHEHGQRCGIRAINSLVRDGQSSGKFTLSGFVTAPYVGCSGRQVFHCQLAYNTEADGKAVRLISTICDPAMGGSDEE